MDKIDNVNSAIASAAAVEQKAAGHCYARLQKMRAGIKAGTSDLKRLTPSYPSLKGKSAVSSKTLTETLKASEEKSQRSGKGNQQ